MKKNSVLLFIFLSVLNFKSFANLTLESSAFTQNSLIPVEYTCYGANQSPPLTWHNIPAKTQSLVLIFQDRNPFGDIKTHWILFNIPPATTRLEAGGQLPEGTKVGENSWGSSDYRGPCPTIGAYTYVFKLYALDNILTLSAGASNDSILQEITSHVIGSAELIGLFQKLQ